MLLSIVVLSYNRPKQVERILKNFLGVQDSNFNIFIKDDLSPNLLEIKNVVQRYVSRLGVEVILYVNKENMGYDKNLIDSFEVVNSDYLFLLSDDDYIRGAQVTRLLSVLSKREFNLYYTPYTDGPLIKRQISDSYDIKRFSDVIYNSILFSGLIFSRSAVCSINIDYNFLSDCIYSQVYLASLLVYQQSAYGVMPSGILFLGGDGENYFGKNKSATNPDLLSDRKIITANLAYQKFLIRVVEEVSKNTSYHIKFLFMREYNKRLIGYGLKSRSYGLKIYLKFLSACFSSNGQVQRYPLMILFIIIFVPTFLSRMIYGFGVKYNRKSG